MPCTPPTPWLSCLTLVLRCHSRFLHPPSSQASGYSAEQLVDAGFMVIEIFLDEEKQDLYSQILLKLENDLDDARNLLYQHLTTADVDLFDLIWFKLDVRSMF